MNATITRNAVINWIILLVQGTLLYHFGWIALLFYPSFFIASYVFAHVTSISLFDTEEMVRQCYSYVDSFLKLQNSGTDLGFNFWDKPEMTNKEAQQRKWDYILMSLKLNPGDWLLDVGCGYGDWLNYARKKGINVMGLNISMEQARSVKEKFDIDVINMGFADFHDIISDESHPEFDKYHHMLGKFNAVTFMDTIEHYAPPQFKWFPKKQDAVYEKMFHMTELVSGPASRLFISCLHTNSRTMDTYQRFCWYILDNTMCGLYPHEKDGLTKNAHSYNVIHIADRTEDYRLSAVKASEGWQHRKLDFGLGFIRFWKKVLYFFIMDPFLLYHLLSQVFDAWMSLYGKDPYYPEYDPERRRELSNVNLYMILLEKKIEVVSSAGLSGITQREREEIQ